MSKFEPLTNIQDRADLFTDENVRLLAELLHTDAAEFARLYGKLPAEALSGCTRNRGVC